MSGWHLHEANGSIHRDQPGLFGGTEDTCPTSPKHPVVVIDPEDAEQVERFREIASRWADDVPYDAGPGDLDYTDAMQAALREFANPSPRIEEPTGLGAVVEDAEGRQWIRNYAAPDSAPWRSAQVVRNFIGWRFWDDVHAVRILSEGVPS